MILKYVFRTHLNLHLEIVTNNINYKSFPHKSFLTSQKYQIFKIYKYFLGLMFSHNKKKLYISMLKNISPTKLQNFPQNEKKLIHIPSRKTFLTSQKSKKYFW